MVQTLLLFKCKLLCCQANQLLVFITFSLTLNQRLGNLHEGTQVASTVNTFQKCQDIILAFLTFQAAQECQNPCVCHRNVTRPKVCQMRANKYEKINELKPDIKMSSANAFVSHAISSAFIPWPVPLHYIVDYKRKDIHTIKATDKNILLKFIEFCNTGQSGEKDDRQVALILTYYRTINNRKRFSLREEILTVETACAPSCIQL